MLQTLQFILDDEMRTMRAVAVILSIGLAISWIIKSFKNETPKANAGSETALD